MPAGPEDPLSDVILGGTPEAPPPAASVVAGEGASVVGDAAARVTWGGPVGAGTAGALPCEAAPDVEGTLERGLAAAGDAPDPADARVGEPVPAPAPPRSRLAVWAGAACPIA